MSTLEIQELGLHIGTKTLCTELNLSVDAGQTWAILGPNGSGKTTFLHTLAGLRHCDTGSIRLKGEELATLSARERARRLGILLQDQLDVFPGSVAEAVLAGRHPYKGLWQWESETDYQHMRQALAQVDLAGFESRPLDTLSGGERRRVAVATLLTQDPPIMLLDEPTNHLDPRHQLLLLHHMQALAQLQGKLLIMVLHDVNLARRFCSHAMLLFGDGRVVTGPVQEVMTATSLGQLYQCKMKEVQADGHSLFYSE